MSVKELRSHSEVSALHIPPHDIEAEQACLGACLLDPEALDRVAEILSGSEDFYREAHQEIYGALLALAEKNQNLDLITCANQLKSQNQLDTI